MTSKFRRGETTFPCEECGRLTRHTGVQSIGVQMCPECYEVAGLENEQMDYGDEYGAIQAQIDALNAIVVAKGGVL